MRSAHFGSFQANTVALVTLVYFCVLSCQRISDDSLSGNWKAIAAYPAADALVLQQAAKSNCIWKVSRDAKSSRIKVEQASKFSRERGLTSRLQTDTGILVGTDRGEYGGSLVLTDVKGTRVKTLLSESVVQLMPVQSGTLVFTGLLHLSADHGAVWLYAKDSKGSPAIRKLFDLDGDPRAISSEGKDILVVTGHSAYRIDQGLNLFEMALLPLAQTLPNSVSEDFHGRIYLGMNAFVVRLVPATTGYTHQWFTKPGCLP